jgi:tetratricopeptide (TPR) repeat protein
MKVKLKKMRAGVVLACIAISLLTFAGGIEISRAQQGLPGIVSACSRSAPPAEAYAGPSRQLAPLMRGGPTLHMERETLARTHIDRGMTLLRSLDHRRALAEFELAIELEQRSSLAFTGKAQVYLARGEYDRVIESANTAIRLYPGNAVAYSLRANAYAEKKENRRAIEDLELTIKIDPHCFAGYMERGVVYARMGDRESSKKDFDRAASLDSGMSNSTSGFVLVCNQAAPLSALAGISRKDRGRCLFERTRAYVRKNEFARAMIELDLAMAFDPNLVTASNLAGRGFLFTRLGKYDEAMRDLGEALRLEPGYALALNNRCEVRAIIGALDEALADCDEALLVDPNVTHYLDSRGVVYLKKGAIGKALADFDAALRIDPKFAHALYGRGIARRLRGDRLDGESDLAGAEAINPDVVRDYARYGLLK